MNPWVQFGLALPVYVVGMEFFGRSAINSIRSGIPNMNVLIALGSTAAFLYSTYGLFTHRPEDFLFFETAASILTIVFFGNWMEDFSVARTQREIKKLTRQQKVMANMIAYDDKHQEQVFPVDSASLRVGDLVLIRTGEQVPADCKLLSGDAEVSEALLSIDWWKRSGEWQREGLCNRGGQRHRNEWHTGNDEKGADGKASGTAIGRQDQRLVYSISAGSGSHYPVGQSLYRRTQFYRKPDAQRGRIGDCLPLRHGPGNACCHCSGPWSCS
jgi:hypothetical protein